MLSYESDKAYSMNDIAHIVMNHSRDDVFRYAMGRHMEVRAEQSLDEICRNFDQKFVTSEWWTGSLSSYRILSYLDDVYANFDRYCYLWYSLEDSLSRKTMMGELLYRIFADFEKLKPVEDIEEYFNRFFQFDYNEVYVDCGAYVGDTVLSFLKYVEGKAKRIYAYECIPSMYQRCINNLQVKKSLPHDALILRPYAVSDDDKILSFSEITEGLSQGGYQSGTGNLTIQALALDDDIQEPISMIKMDIEGSEKDALFGAKRHIAQDHPKMAICVYHLPDDIWRIPALIKSINPDYTFFLRRHSVVCSSHEYVTPWDMVLYCVPRLAVTRESCARRDLQEYFYQRFPVAAVLKENSGLSSNAKMKELVRKIQSARNICCYGLGRLFQDHFHSKSIDSALWRDRVNLLSDGRRELWGQRINGIPVCSPQELVRFEDLLVITHVLHDAPIKKSLSNLGINNVINIFDLFELVGQRYEVSQENDVFFY